MRKNWPLILYCSQFHALEVFVIMYRSSISDYENLEHVERKNRCFSKLIWCSFMFKHVLQNIQSHSLIVVIYIINERSISPWKKELSRNNFSNYSKLEIKVKIIQTKKIPEFIFSHSRYLDQTVRITIENNEQRRNEVVIVSNCYNGSYN